MIGCCFLDHFLLCALRFPKAVLAIPTRFLSRVAYPPYNILRLRAGRDPISSLGNATPSSSLRCYLRGS